MCKDGKKKTNRVFTDQHRKKPLMVVYKEQVMKKREKKTRTKFKESISDRQKRKFYIANFGEPLKTYGEQYPGFGFKKAADKKNRT